MLVHAFCGYDGVSYGVYVFLCACVRATVLDPSIWIQICLIGLRYLQLGR